MSDERRIYPTLLDAIPFAIVTGFFLLITALNWQYELKFFQPLPGHSDDKYYLGPILFIIGMAFASVSSGFFFLLRRSWSDGHWVGITGSALVCLACLIMGLSFIVLGPAALTMREQMGEVPQPHSAH